MSATEQIVDLLRSMPPLSAPPAVRGVWFRKKADTFEAMANESDSVMEAFECREAAEEARRMAAELGRCPA